MSSKIDFPLGSSGLDVRVWLFSDNQIFRPAASAFVTPSTLTGAQITAALTALTEQLSSDSIGLGNYPLDLSTVTGLPSGKLITVVYVLGAASPGDPNLGLASGYWDGTNFYASPVYSVAAVSAGAITSASFASGTTVDANLTKISGSAVDPTQAQVGVNLVNWAGYVQGVDAQSHIATVNIGWWLGVSPPAPATGGVPIVDTNEVLRSGTPQAATLTTVTLDVGASSQDDIYTGGRLTLTDNFGKHAASIVTAYNGTTKVATVSPAFSGTPTGTLTFSISSAAANVQGWKSVAVGALGNPTGASYAADIASAGTSAASASSTASTINTKIGTPASSVSADIAAVNAKTTNLPSDPSSASTIAGSFTTVNSTLATIGGNVNTQVPAIKAKTDNLPASPAAVGSAMTLAASQDVYHLSVIVTANAANTQDNYLIQFLDNNVKIAAGSIAGAVATVYKASDGSALFSSASLIQIGTTDWFSLSRTSPNRLTPGLNYILSIAATVSGTPRTFEVPIALLA